VRRLAIWRAAWRAVNIDPSPTSWNARSKLMKFARRGASRQPPFYARLANDYGSDLDLEVVIRENRKINPGPGL